MRKIIHIITTLNVGGAELMLQRLILNSRSDFEHVVVNLSQKGPVESKLQDVQVKVYNLDINNNGLILSFLTLFKILLSEKPSIVQTWLYHADFLGGIAAYICRVPVIIWGIRTLELTKGSSRNTYWIRSINASLSKFIPTKIICCAQKSTQHHIQLGYSAEKLITIPNGFEIHDRQDQNEIHNLRRSEWGIYSDSTILIGAVGRYDNAKDYPNFLQMASIIANKYNNVKFILIGRELTTQNSKIMDLIDQYKLSNCVILAGERSDVGVCLSNIDIFCLSSKYEAFPNVVCEAMIGGLPCVVTDAGDASLILGNSEYVVPTENPHALAGAIEKMLLLSPEQRRIIGEKNKRRICSEFSLQNSVKKYCDLYHETLQGVK